MEFESVFYSFLNNNSKFPFRFNISNNVIISDYYVPNMAESETLYPLVTKKHLSQLKIRIISDVPYLSFGVL